MRIHHVALRTPDPDRLARFYCDVIGLSELRRDEGRSIWLGAGETIWMIERSGSAEPSPHPNSMEMIALSIGPQERDAYRRALLAAGVRLEGETAYTLYFRDPEGRRVGLSHFPTSAA